MKKRIFKFVVLCLTLLGLYDVVTCSVMIYPAQKGKNLMQYKGPVSKEEMQIFLETWEEFMVKVGQEEGFSALSFTEQAPSKVLPEEMVTWLNKKRWDVDRFFYAEQRMYDILDDVYLKRHAQDVEKILKESLKSEGNPALRENMESIIAKQEELLNSRRVNSEEFKFIEKHFNEIQKVLDR